MKNLIFSVLVMITFSCNSSSDKEIPTMPGTYFMTHQILNDGETETKYDDLKQLKIYTDDFFMYVQVNPNDSVSAFGVGWYSTDTASVVENVIFSASDTSFNNTPKTYNLNITKTFEGYEQVIPEIIFSSKKYKLTESYNKTGTDAKTALDGVWKEINSYTLNGNDTIQNNRTQYKAFYNGYFMFGHSYTGDDSKRHTGVGFGTFVKENDNKIKETDLNSTYAMIAGQTFDIDIEMDGKDAFKQIVNNADGSKGVEFYQRVKK